MEARSAAVRARGTAGGGGREGWAGHAESRVRAAGHRASTARSRVIELLGEQECVLTARDIADRLRGEGVGVATVYRALELLEGLGLIQRLDVGEGTARYEPALPSGEHHHHLVCDTCGRVSAFADPQLERAIARVAGRLDYRVGAHDVILRGECPSCST
jgi:Fur family transcriptional regulator, ferric uptake regulator